jgi:hypothetical protein
MDKENQVDARVQTRDGVLTVMGKASSITDRSVSVQCGNFIQPGTKVETFIYSDEPTRIEGKVEWSIIQLGGEEVFYDMGISVEYQESIS